MSKPRNVGHEDLGMERDIQRIRRRRLAKTAGSLVIMSKTAGQKAEARKDKVLVRRNP
jgi:GH24 family phage-related lysozyme (muramidase)